MVLDTQSGDTAIRNGILEGVAALGSDYSIYGPSNIAVTGTHNHNGPVCIIMLISDRADMKRVLG